MRKRLVMLLLALASTLPAVAGTYTLTTTAAQDTALERARQRANARRASQGLPPFATIQALLDEALATAAQDVLEQLKAGEGEDFCTRWRTTMTRGQKTMVCVSPGVGLPPDCDVCR